MNDEVKRVEEADYVPIAALNQYAFCPHRCWRMFCTGEFVDNQYTLEGTGLHERVHTLGSSQREEVWQVRSIWLKSDRYGLIGKSDLVERQDGRLCPVEYKRGQKGEFGNDALQVCAQALCLEDMTGQVVVEGFVYYAHSHQRRRVEMTTALREEVIATIQTVRSLIRTGMMPLPIYKKRCQGCSLRGQCLPMAAKKLKRYQEAT